MESSVKNALTMLVGPRGAGKSTLLEMLFPPGKWRTLRLDGLDDLEAARTLPLELMGAEMALVVDEAQAAPELLVPLRHIAEREKRSVRFVVACSGKTAQLADLIALAGRDDAVIPVLPMAAGEVAGRGDGELLERLFHRDPPPAPEKLGPAPPQGAGGQFHRDPPPALEKLGPPPPQGAGGQGRATRQMLPTSVARGGFPGAVLGSGPGGSAAYLREYERTFLERDTALHGGVGDLFPFRRALRGAALQAGGLVNLAAIAPEAGVSAPTVRRYLELADRAMVGVLVAPLDIVRRKRLIKAPKFYLRDSGLACHLCGVATGGDLVFSPLFQQLLETWVLQQISARCAALVPAPEVRYWRTADNREVDFVVMWKKKLLAIDVRHTDALKPVHWAGVSAFCEEYSDLAALGVVVYSGREVVRLKDNIYAVPSAMFV